ncbi:molybdopterin-dependent oxidoreductase [Celeribacter sp.]|uniref:molybdopterin-dependent oxidoreductase n=1 Tax=Celeribacter sp. TaxID=1890673 RepID=UPI003A905034
MNSGYAPVMSTTGHKDHWAPPLSALAVVILGIGAAAAQADDLDLPAPTGEVVLTITGNIAHQNAPDSALLDAAMIDALPRFVLETSTVVTDGVNRFDGVLMRDLLDLVGAEGKTVTATALNDYIIDIPMEDFEGFDVVAATHMDGELLLPSDKGPLWIVYPRDDHEELQDIRYDYRWVWQLIHLDIQ